MSSDLHTKGAIPVLLLNTAWILARCKFCFSCPLFHECLFVFLPFDTEVVGKEYQ